MIPRRKPVGVIRQPFSSGIGVKDRVEFIRCVGGQQPQIHELWTFAENLPQSLENARATARRIRDPCLWEHRIARAQNLLDSQHIIGDDLVNRSNDNWDGWVNQ